MNPGSEEQSKIIRLYRELLASEPPFPTRQRAKAIFDPRRGDESRWLKRLGPVSATLVSDSRARSPGEHEGSAPFVLAYASPLGEIELTIEPSDAPSRLNVFGRVNPTGKLDVRTVMFSDRGSTGVMIHAELIDRAGFRVQLTVSRYDLFVRLGDTIVVIEDLELE